MIGAGYFDYKDEDERDNVNHPKHYENCSLECIEMMEVVFGSMAVINFCLCNAFKYTWRYKSKNGIEDLKKAKWYIDKAFELNELDFDLSLEQEEMLERMKEYCEKNIKD